MSKRNWPAYSLVPGVYARVLQRSLLHLLLFENCCGDVSCAAEDDGDPHLPSSTVLHRQGDARVFYPQVSKSARKIRMRCKNSSRWRSNQNLPPKIATPTTNSRIARPKACS